MDVCSAYEGFGLPIIEAQALKTPAVTSNIDPMNDVAGKGVCLVEPFDSNSIRAGIVKVSDDKTYRNNLIKNGLTDISRVDSKSIANRYEQLYEEILNP